MTDFDDNRVAARERLHRPVPRERRKVRGQVSELVVEDERCDKEFEQAEADRRREAWLDEQNDRQKARRAVRRQMTLGQRLDVALREVGLGTGTRARPIATMKSSSAEGSPSSRSQPHVAGADIDHASEKIREHLATIEQATDLIRHHLVMIEQAADIEQGLARHEPVGDTPGHTGVQSGATDRAGRMLTGQEKDRVIFDDFQGVPASQVAQEAPYLGKDARTVERARVREAAIRELRVNPATGEVLGKVEKDAA